MQGANGRNRVRRSIVNQTNKVVTTATRSALDRSIFENQFRFVSKKILYPISYWIRSQFVE